MPFPRSARVDYRQMSVGLNGSLAGEIITNFDFDGGQAGRRSQPKLRHPPPFATADPVQGQCAVGEFLMNCPIDGAFLWDVDFLGNPVDRGLLKAEDGRFVPANPAAPVSAPSGHSVQTS